MLSRHISFFFASRTGTLLSHFSLLGPMFAIALFAIEHFFVVDVVIVVNIVVVVVGGACSHCTCSLFWWTVDTEDRWLIEFALFISA